MADQKETLLPRPPDQDIAKQSDVDSLNGRIDALALTLDNLIKTHKHDGSSSRINLNTDILGLFEVVSVAPTGVPRDVYDQIKIYVNSTTYRLYWYDNVGHVWHYVTATA